jgi:hypothetical protein
VIGTQRTPGQPCSSFLLLKVASFGVRLIVFCRVGMARGWFNLTRNWNICPSLAAGREL